jgi:hypothetical protein
MPKQFWNPGNKLLSYFFAPAAGKARWPPRSASSSVRSRWGIPQAYATAVITGHGHGNAQEVLKKFTGAFFDMGGLSSYFQLNWKIISIFSDKPPMALSCRSKRCCYVNPNPFSKKSG